MADTAPCPRIVHLGQDPQQRPQAGQVDNSGRGGSRTSGVRDWHRWLSCRVMDV
jgi:hypothetical protein